MIEKQIESPTSETDSVEAVQGKAIHWPEQSTTTESFDGQTALLLTGEEIDQLKSRWEMLQREFVDDPRPTVQQADALVAEVANRMTQMLAERRANLQERWIQDEAVSTEDLRIALQRYRSFFNRLLEL